MQTIKSFFTSPRFLSFIGHVLAVAAIAGINDFMASIGQFNLPTEYVVIIGLFAAQIVGALKSVVNGQPAGFSGK